MTFEVNDKIAVIHPEYPHRQGRVILKPDEITDFTYNKEGNLLYVHWTREGVKGPIPEHYVKIVK